MIGRIFFCDANANWSWTCFDPARDQLPYPSSASPIGGAFFWNSMTA